MPGNLGNFFSFLSLLYVLFYLLMLELLLGEHTTSHLTTLQVRTTLKMHELNSRDKYSNIYQWDNTRISQNFLQSADLYALNNAGSKECNNFLFSLPNSTRTNPIVSGITRPGPDLYLFSIRRNTSHRTFKNEQNRSMCISVSVSQLITKTFSLQFCKLNPKFSKISEFHVLPLKNYSLGLNPTAPECYGVLGFMVPPWFLHENNMGKPLVNLCILIVKIFFSHTENW